MILTCPCGSKSSPLEQPMGVDGCSEKTGYVPISFDSRIIWLCPACFHKAHKLAEDILKIFGKEQTYDVFSILKVISG